MMTKSIEMMLKRQMTVLYVTLDLLTRLEMTILKHLQHGRVQNQMLQSLSAEV